MGRLRKRFNWKARQVSQVEIVKSTNAPIPIIELDEQKGTFYDDANSLALPSEKRRTKKVIRNRTPTKILSKNQRKKLEKIVERKKKKIESAKILASLYDGDIQACNNELNHLTSIAVAITKGRKRLLTERTASNDQVSIEGSIMGPSEEDGADSSCKSRKRKKKPNVTPEVPVSSHDLVAFDSGPSESESEPENNETRESFGTFKSDSDLEEGSEIVREMECKLSPVSSAFEIKVENIGCDEQKALVRGKSKENEDDNMKVTPREGSVWVPVNRSSEIDKLREKLPILAEEHNIMEMVHNHDVVIVAGETGSGKTTQVPQFLFEAGFTRKGKMIGVTQPRRVAAISMSARVAHELNLSSDVVSYLIRFEGNVTDRTQIKFMTDGVLLKEVQTDFTLSNYSAIILDEAHERNTYTDILIGLLSRIVPLRRKRGNPLKLIIMSATLRIEDFTSNSILFKSPPPVMKLNARQFPVSVHFSRSTPEDYLTEVFRKVCKIHDRLPEGGILVFVTGQREVCTLVKKLRARYPFNAATAEAIAKAKEIDKKLSRRMRAKLRAPLPDVNLDKYGVISQDDTEGDRLEEEEEEEVNGNASDDDNDEDEGFDLNCAGEPMFVLPFYSLLPPAEQAKVFRQPPAGCRFCVVSTNVAETSLTIPGIKYVVDTGRTKTRLYDKLTGVSTFTVTWCSKASANQRAGRAGRLGPGHCYRLYSSAVFNDKFQQFGEPEIRQKPVDALVLSMKALNIVKVVNFPFPTPPDCLQLRMAERRLQQLGALECPPNQDGNPDGRLTDLGRTMAYFPVAPRYAKMLALSQQHGLLAYVVCIVAALSVPEVLVENEGDKKWAVMRKAWAGAGNLFLLGDVMVLLRAVGAAECTTEPLDQFCMRHGLRPKALREIRKLRVQLTTQLNMHSPGLSLVADPNLPPPSDMQAKLLRQIILAGLSDLVAMKIDPNTMTETEDKLKWKRAYKSTDIEEPIVIRSQSVLSKELPKWVAFQEVYESNDKLYMRGVTAIEPEWLPLFAPSLCKLSEPKTDPPPRYNSETGSVEATVSGTYGRAGLELPIMKVPYTTTIASFKWFARFLLQGDVCEKLQRFRASLLSSPTTMVKSWAKLQPRTEILLNTLIGKDINTKSKLLTTWKKEPSYLLTAYQKWLPESARADLAAIWPPI